MDHFHQSLTFISNEPTGGDSMRRVFLMAAALACAPLAAPAQQAVPAQQQTAVFDTGWRQVAPDALPDLGLSGAGVRINNLLVQQDQEIAGNQLALYVFSASTFKRVAGKRSVRIDLVGFGEDGKPTLIAVLTPIFLDEPPNTTSNDRYRFAASPAEFAGTKSYWVRMVVLPR
jgi:hypothetical protein